MRESLLFPANQSLDDHTVSLLPSTITVLPVIANQMISDCLSLSQAK